MRKATSDYNLAVKFPEISKEWHPTKNDDLTPEQVPPGSNSKAWWKCKRGHEWDATIKNRTSGHGCPKCYAEVRGELFTKSVIKKRGSLASNHPDIAKQWHPTKNGKLKPEQFTPGSHRKV